jgi:hypothetical protein
MAIIQNPKAIFPDLPRETPTIDKDGHLSPLWSLGFASLFQALQKNFRNTGILFPSITTDEANEVVAIYSPYIGSPLPPGLDNVSGQTAFNTTLSLPQIFIIAFDTRTPPNITGVKWWTFTIT